MRLVYDNYVIHAPCLSLRYRSVTLTTPIPRRIFIDFFQNIAWVFWVNRVFGVFTIYPIYPKNPKYCLCFFFSKQTTNPYNQFFFIRLYGFALLPNNLITSILRTFREHILRPPQKVRRNRFQDAFSLKIKTPIMQCVLLPFLLENY